MPKNKVKDPVQQTLRQHKRQWNALYRDFAVKMKAFKNSINGKGDTKFSLPPSDIKDPLPTEVASFLSQLAGEFQQLAGSAETIISEQSNYSGTRKKKQPKPVGGPASPGPTPISAPINTATTLEQAVGYYYDHSIQKVGSNKLTRFWEYVSSVFSTDANKKHRAGLLSSSADLYYEFLNFENSILSLNIDSIPQSLNHFQNIKYSFEALKKSFERLMQAVEEKIKEGELPQPPADESIEQDVPDEYQEPVLPPQQESKEDKDVKRISKDLHLIYDIGLGGDALLDINQLLAEYNKESDPEGRSLIRDRIVDEYKDLVKSIIGDVQKKYGPVQVNSLQDIVNLIEKNQPRKASYNLEIKKVAHNFATRFLKKQLLKARPYNKTAVHRLEADRLIDLAQKTLNQMMDSLQGGNNMFSSVKDYMEKLEEIINNLGKPLSILSVYYKEEFYNRHKKRKSKDKTEEDIFQDSAVRNKIRKDLQKDLF